jgi:hypothetical protein
MDIHSNDSRTHKLSNFYPHQFTVNSIVYSSMEAFLQCLKFDSRKDDAAWAYCTDLSGFAAKQYGRRAPDWRKHQVLFYGGSEVRRDSPEYQDILDRAYIHLYDQCPEFKQALIATKGHELEHTIGKRVRQQTVLTEEEFVSRLMKLREHGDK